MTASVLNMTFDCRDAESVARFWEGVTEYALASEDQPGNPFWVLPPNESNLPRLVFVTVPETKSIKNRVHLDLVPTIGPKRPRCLVCSHSGPPSWMIVAPRSLVGGS